MQTHSKHNVFAAGPEIISVATWKWLPPQRIDRGLLLFIHGFTANGEYFREFAEYFSEMGYCCAIYNYDSYVGIDTAGRSLCQLLDPYEDQVGRYGLALICHSMGGLVARCMLRQLPPKLKQGVCGLVTLGTPHRGTLYDRRIVSFALDSSEVLAGSIHPFLRLPLCTSALQMTRSDSAELLSHLAGAEGIPVLSISGGLAFLEIGEPGVFSRVRNRVLQRLIGEKVNDGLVGESSANYIRAVSGEVRGVTHLNDYEAWPQTNHTNLIHRQDLANRIQQWLKSNSFLDSASGPRRRDISPNMLS